MTANIHSEPKTNTIGLKTNINVQLLITVIALGAPLLAGMSAVYFDVKAIKADIRNMRRDLSNAWTYQDQMLWYERLKSENKGMVIPSPTDVYQSIHPKSGSLDP